MIPNRKDPFSDDTWLIAMTLSNGDSTAVIVASSLNMAVTPIKG